MSMLQAEEDPSKRQRLYETSQRFHDLLGKTEEVIVGYSANLSSITDRDVREAVVSLRSTYRTEQKGVIYEHASSNPLVHALVRELRNFLEDYREKVTDQGTSLRLSDIVACLEFIEVDVGYHLEKDPGQNGYLHFIARSHPDLMTKPDQGGIILAP